MCITLGRLLLEPCFGPDRDPGRETTSLPSLLALLRSLDLLLCSLTSTRRERRLRVLDDQIVRVDLLEHLSAVGWFRIWETPMHGVMDDGRSKIDIEIELRSLECDGFVSADSSTIKLASPTSNSLRVMFCVRS